MSSPQQQVQSGHQSLQEAVDEFKKLLSAQERSQLEGGKPPFNVIDITNALDSSNTAVKLVNRCAPLIQSIQQFSGIVDTMIQHDPFISALVWGSIKFLFQVAQNYSSYFVRLTECLEKLGKLCPIFSEFQSLLPNSPRLRDAIAGFYALIITFCCKALKFLRLSGDTQFFKSLWKPFDIGFKDIEGAIQSQQKLVDYEIRLASEAAAFEQRQRENLFCEQGVKHQEFEIQQWDHNKKWIQKLERRAKSNEKRQLKQWTQDTEWRLKQDFKEKDYDHTATFLEARRKRHKVTGNWLYTSPQYCNWLSQQTSSLLCCHGIPGSGKTVLATGVIENIYSRSGSSQHRTFIGYFFCDFSMPRSLLPEVIIRSFIKQILVVFHGSPNFENDINSFFTEHKNIPTMDAWHKLFIRVSSILSPESYFFVDGLDECSEDHQRDLLDFISILIGLERRIIKFFISTRPEIYILRFVKRISSEKATLIDLNAIEYRPEIEAFIEQSLSERLADGRLAVQDPSTIEEIQNALVHGAKGMFLWVQFQIYDICRQLNDEEIRRTLLSLPRDLDETYIRILRRIEKERRIEIAIELFTCMAAAKRPLTLGELQEAISIQPSDSTWNQVAKRMPTHANKLLENCGNLVVLTESLDPIIQFAHSTVLKFLTSYHKPKVLGEFHIDLKLADMRMGRLCLAYLHFPELQKQVQTIPVSPTVNVSFPNAPRLLIPPDIPTNSLFRVAGNLLHQPPLEDGMGLQLSFRKACQGDGGSQRANALVKEKFPLLDYIIQYWIHHCSELPYEPKSPDETGRSARMFRDVVLKEMIPFTRMPWNKESGISSDQESEVQWQQFNWAVRNNHRPLLQLVLSEVINKEGSVERYIGKFLNNEVTIYGFLPEQPCLVAALLGHRVLLDFLLSEQQADVDREYLVNNSGITLLMGAAIQGHVETVELLLRLQATVNHSVEASATSWRTAIGGACAVGHLAVIQKLMDHGADPNSYEGEALRAAAANRQLEALEVFIKFGTATVASLNSALIVAAKAGYMDMFNQLLDGGASHEPGLVAASETGQMEILLALLERPLYWELACFAKALTAAARHGHSPVVARLLQFATDGGYQIAEYSDNSSLYDATYYGHLEVVRQLIDFHRREYTQYSHLTWSRWAKLKASILCQSITDALIIAMRREYREFMGVESENTGTKLSLIYSKPGKPTQTTTEYLLSADANIPRELISSALFQISQNVELMWLALGSVSVNLDNARLHLDFASDFSPQLQWYTEHPGDWVVNLIQASEDGNLEAVARLLQFDSPNDRQVSRGLALIGACKGGHIHVVKTILGLEYGLTIDQQENWSISNLSSVINAQEGAALIEAAARGYIDVVKVLLEVGAAASTCSSRLAALMAASQAGHLEIVRELLKTRRIEFLVPSLTLEPPLVSTLLTHEKIVSLATEYRNNKQTLVEALINCGVNVNDLLLKEDFLPFKEAILRNDLLALEIMIDAGLNVAAHGARALIMACTFNRIDFVYELLSLGVDVNSYEYSGAEFTALMAAIQHADCDVLVLLLDEGANPNVQLTPPDNIQSYLDKEYDFEVKPLHYACRTTIYSAEKVQILLDAGADIDACDAYGRTTLDIAIMNHQNGSAAILRSAGAKAQIDHHAFLFPVLRAKQLEEAVRGREDMMLSGVFELDGSIVHVEI